MHKIIITDYINNPSIEKNILKDFEIICLNEIKEEKFDQIIFEAYALLVWHAKITEKTISKLKNCKAIVRYGVGYDDIDINACKKYGIPFANTPDYGTDEVSDTTIGFILNITRGINQYNYISKKIPNTWQENLKKSLRRTAKIKIGIIGAGRIGSSVIRKLNSIGFRCSFFDPYVNVGYEKVLQCEKSEDLNKLLKQSDIISIHTPATAETIGMIDEKFIKKMKKGSSLVNTARGSIIKNMNVIYESLINNKLDCIAFDVLPEEPPSIKNNIIKDWISDSKISSRIVITNHTSYYSKESFKEMREKVSKNILNLYKHKKLTYRII